MRFTAPLFKFTLLNFLMISTVLADQNDNYNDCWRLHIQIGNATPSPCSLVQSKVIHGSLSSSPPSVIFPGMTERFDMHQTFRGPEIQLKYLCNGKQITFSSQQNYCLFRAGNIATQVISHDSAISAFTTTENGSYYWGKPGFVNWVLIGAVSK